MRPVFVYAGVVVAILVAGVISARQNTPVPRPPYMELPLDYRSSFVQYATVDRSDNISRNLYISRDSLAALEVGKPFPEGTRIIVEAFAGQPDENGRLAQANLLPFIHMAEKREKWRIEDLQTAVRVGDWNFASFMAGTGEVADPSIPEENLSDCFTCHDVSATPRRDFIFTNRLLNAYLARREIQYLFCNLPDRIPGCQ